MQKIVQHLVNSPNHALSQTDAEEIVANRPDCVQQEEWAEEIQTQRAAPYVLQGNSSGKGSGRQQQQLRMHDELVQVRVDAATAHAAAALTGSQLRLEQQAIRCEQAARSTAKLARAAAAAFDEEAQTLRDLIDEIRRSAV